MLGHSILLMNTLKQLQQWYHKQCDGDWEHTWGVRIGTLDNPGWEVEIDLVATVLEDVLFLEQSYGMGEAGDTSGDEWLMCKVEGHVFTGFGGPFKLDEIIEIFLKWAEDNESQTLS